MHLLEYSKQHFEARFDLTQTGLQIDRDTREVRSESYKYLLPIPFNKEFTVILDGENVRENFRREEDPVEQKCSSSSGSFNIFWRPEKYNHEWFFGLGRTSRYQWSQDSAMIALVIGRSWQVHPNGTLRVLYRGRKFSHGIAHGGDILYSQVPQAGWGYTLGISQALAHWHSMDSKHYIFAGYHATTTNTLSGDPSKKWIDGYQLHFESGYSRQVYPRFYIGTSAGISFASLKTYNQVDEFISQDQRLGRSTLRIFFSVHPSHTPITPQETVLQ
ncbi:MAG: hypothetical protein OXT67_06690 [Zetaproteobacteria bacterium]|nr:hypothetical protein [Zetaproteobacteria bacterium]